MLSVTLVGNLLVTQGKGLAYRAKPGCGFLDDMQQLPEDIDSARRAYWETCGRVVAVCKIEDKSYSNIFF